MNKSLGFYSLRYAMYYVIVVVAVFVIAFCLYRFLPDIAESIFSGGGGTGVSVVSVILPPMLVAQLFYKHEVRRMTGGEGWMLAFVFTVLAFVLSAATLWIGIILQPLAEYEAAGLLSLWNEERDILLIVAAVTAVVLILINKLMLWSGVRGSIKQEERLAAKQARKG
ncbi:ABZJ_00895 family protein [Octadecabacter ascidiaceicola]|uniref:Uncharacterized protein n=1 Tax=Octadecabacter ascidiaceicola TaxID=1655543 RepID=A0A238KNZ1_9RHOB|nr:ABZJ_00895 family protein [Octadecabacter ascidiaceicola]SMX44350.1 hypothetical protein OCA8868_03126 [Octadecabacter ascidiaceicola]